MKFQELVALAISALILIIVSVLAVNGWTTAKEDNTPKPGEVWVWSKDNPFSKPEIIAVIQEVKPARWSKRKYVSYSVGPDMVISDEVGMFLDLYRKADTLKPEYREHVFRSLVVTVTNTVVITSTVTNTITVTNQFPLIKWDDLIMAATNGINFAAPFTNLIQQSDIIYTRWTTEDTAHR